jgi:hypothetical protein
MLVLLCGTLAAAAPLSTGLAHESAIGLATEFFQEQTGRLELSDAVAALRAGQFTPGKSQVLNFGIGSKPTWIHFAVDNPTTAPAQKRLSIETAWLDRADVYFLHPGRTLFRARPCLCSGNQRCVHTHRNA